MSSLLQPLFGDPEIEARLADRAYVQHLLDVEVALVEAQAALSLVPSSVVAPIREAAHADHFDLSAIGAQAAADGNLVIPLVRELRARVAQADELAAASVHRGATSQDIADTAIVLQLSSSVPLVLDRLSRAANAARAHAAAHPDTAMAGRTFLQQATPTTFGLTAAGWCDALDRSVQAIRQALDEAMVLQLGGATGTLAAFGDSGPGLASDVATRLGLAVPTLAWHTHRDRLVRLAGSLAVAGGTLGKIGRDIALLAQVEIGELSIDRPGGGSSTMPHKKNPVGPAVILAAALRGPGLLATLVAAMPQELERGVGGWHAEWTALPELVSVVGGAAKAAVDTLEALAVHPDRMRANLRLTSGVVGSEAVSLSLADHLGRERAHEIVAAAAGRALHEGRPLAEILAGNRMVAAVLDRKTLDELTTPDRDLAAASRLVARFLERRKV